MGKRTRALDWSRTPVGPGAVWPQSLKTALRIMLDSRHPMAIWWGRELINFYNDAYIPVLGKRHPIALGKSAPEIWPEIWPIIGPQAEAVLNEGRATWNKELLLILERNQFLEETYFTFSYSPVPDDEGSVGGVFCACSEDTQRVLNQRRLRMLQVLAERAAEAKTPEEACKVAAATLADNSNDLAFALLYLLDGDGLRARLTGSMGLKGDTPANPAVIALEDKDAPWPFRQVVEKGKALEVDDLSARFGSLPGGAWPESPERAVVLPIAKPSRSQFAGFVVVGVSPRLSFTDDYMAFMDLLAGHAATAIANTWAYQEEKKRAEALSELDRAKTTFFTNISHEFRAPLTLMLAPVEELLACSQAELSPAARRQLELVSRNGLRLLRLVNTLLDFSRIEAGRVQALYEPVDLAAFTAELASGFRSACERAGLKLMVDCLPLTEPVYVDREMWEKVVLNLLSNAFKFTFKGELVVSLRQVGRAAELRVKDTGTGIPVAEIPRLFERFYRSQNARGRTHEGSGIGLALARELVKLHGGSIAVESIPGQGSTFIVSIPLGTAHLPADKIGGNRALASTATGAGPYVEEALRWLPDGEEAANEEQQVRPSRAEALPLRALPEVQEKGDDCPQVLVADDNADMRQYLIRLLAEHFYIKAVPDGEAALAAVRKWFPDLILADVMMPRLDGLGLLREVRADPLIRDLPVIILSARAGEESRIEGMSAGADDYVVKPFSGKELLARVGAHLQMARLRREASRALRESEERFRVLVEAASQAVWEANAEGVVVKDSPSWRAYTGQTPEEWLGYGWVNALHPDDRGYVKEVWQKAVAAGRNVNAELRIRGPDGGWRWTNVRAAPLHDTAGKIVKWVGMHLDITDRKLAEEALRESDRRKNEFLGTLAHELRNPLAPLRNGLEVLKLAGDNAEVAEQAYAMMERQLAQMVRLIDDLLDVSRISRGKIELRKERVDLASIIHDAMETARPLIEQADHALTVNMPAEPAYVEADRIRLGQVFSNLLNNAAKFTERGGHIWLTVERQGGEVVAAVRDSGVGIPVPMLPKLFDLFMQGDRSLEKLQGGLGIGLWLVKRLVEMHGGSIEAKSKGAGMGSEFVVCLPLAPCLSGEDHSGGEIETVSHIARRRILVVDDNEDAAASLAMMLNIMGNETQIAHDGLKALDVAAAFKPDMVLLDIGMPKLNGYDTARRIREQPWGRKVVLIALTGWGQAEDKQRSQEAGFNFHMVKPLELEALEKVLSKL